MSLSEFELIERYFRSCGQRREDVTVGVGDDAAVLHCPAGAQLAAAVDTLVEGVHFPRGSPAQSIGHRALAVNLSDLAAMGARPAWALLALTLAAADEHWLAEFAAGLGALARAHGVALVGGDTTRGPLSVTIAVLGHLPPGRALLRRGGAPGDALFVSGTPGDAAAGLALEQGRLAPCEQAEYLRRRFLFPTPRLALGERLRELASGCIDVSDGLLADALKLARASGCGVELMASALPLSAPLLGAVGRARARELALLGGDDYELCFTVRPHALARLGCELPPAEWGYTRIGTLQAQPGARVLGEHGPLAIPASGYEHFAGA
jgi:thiamine-monophosphate kinase